MDTHNNKNTRIGKHFFFISLSLLIILFLSSFVYSESSEPEIKSFDLSEEKVEIEEKVNLNAVVFSPDKNLTEIIIDWGDGKEENIPNPDLDKDGFYLIHGNMYNHKYDEKGSYDINLTLITTNNTQISESKPIRVKETENPDNPPEVEILYPKDNETIEQDSVDFHFKINDDQKIESCDFIIYSNEDEKKEEYSQEFNKEGEFKHLLRDFENKPYILEINCEDNASQKKTSETSFFINAEEFKLSQNVNKVINKIDNFSEKQESLSLEQQKLIEKAELFKDLNNYKKRLIDMEKEIQKNKGIKHENSSRKKKLEEYSEDVEEFNKSIPDEIESIFTKEYIKNEVSDSFEKVIEDFIKEKGFDLNNFQKSMLIEKNREIQKKAGVSVGLNKFEIIYPDKTKTITFVNKKLEVSDDSFDTFIEFFNDIGAKPVFIKEPSEINENIYEVSLGDLEDNELIYYFNEDLKTESLKKTETFLFHRFSTKGIGLVGFATYDIVLVGNSKYVSFAIILLALGLLGWVFYSRKKNTFSKEKILNIKEFLKKGIVSAKQEDLESAKRSYKQIRDIYRELPKEAKSIVYPKLMKLRVEIDKREMRNLIREYKDLKTQGNREEADKIYEKIKEKYTRLPKKYRKQISQKVLFK
ncbi:MAG: hypothetical protein ACOC1P_02455 [Minisyncoccales bacterium]